MQLQLVLLILFFNYVRGKSKTSREFAAWRIPGWIGVIAGVALFIATVVLQKPSLAIYVITYPVVIAVITLIFVKAELRILKGRLYVFLPAIIVNFLVDTINLVNPAYVNTYKAYFLAGGVFSIIWLIVTAYLNSNQEKALLMQRQIAEERDKELKITEKVMSQLEAQVVERTAALTKQKSELEAAILKLNKTQAQLVHAEKMASLGELTAGIAHEIQNPLNFVNNFSDVNRELLAELTGALKQGNIDEAVGIAADIISNEEKINLHGKRAQSIVTGMLQHSRSDKGEKQLTDINKLANEYLRLAYHGLRSKDKRFNAEIVTDFDENIGQIMISPQQIGRVILNVANNAFYAVAEKAKQVDTHYKPLVAISTTLLTLPSGNMEVCIAITDNGFGIPETIRDKIFQPFFTTKPTGQGTGLGLSLSYDMVKAHAGEIVVQSNEGEGTTFIIHLKKNELS